MVRAPIVRLRLLALLPILVAAGVDWGPGGPPRTATMPPIGRAVPGAKMPAAAPRAAAGPAIRPGPDARTSFRGVASQPLSPGDEREVVSDGPGSYASIFHRQARAAEVWRRESAALAAIEGEAAPRSPLAIQAGPQLAPDIRANDRDPLTCAGQCQNLPIIQTEAAVAVLGPNLVAGWNEGEVNCGGINTRQSYGWSTDGGVSFTDGNGLFPVLGSVNGDAIVQVNAKTQQFYMAGIGNLGASLRGISIIRGSFGPGGFTPGLRGQSTSGVNQLHDKPWMNVDSLSGNVYVCWARFGPAASRIEFQALNSDLIPIGPVHTLSDTSAGSSGAQFSQIVVGPDGEVWVSWLEYHLGTPYLALRIRRSDDHGQSFGPVADVLDYAVNAFHGGVGFLRPFASHQPNLAVDRSNGPYRGRLYLSFDASLDYRDDVIPITTATFESEPNNSAATANPMNLAGGRLRGLKTGVDSDWFTLDLEAGQTFFLETVYAPDFSMDSTRAGLLGRIWCPSGGGLAQAVRATATSNGILFTARHTGIYYLELSGAANDTTGYVFTTAIVPVQPSDVSLDSRDQLLTWSDDGVGWSTPVRVNDTPPGVDGQYPTVGVDGRGRVHVYWMDFRADTDCGLLSDQYMRSSGDGGVTWGPARRISDASSSWAGPYCNQLNGNTQGDYQTIATDGDIVAAAWTDARYGDPDILLDVSVHRTEPQCDPVASAIAGVDTLVDFVLTNAGNYDRTLSWRIEETRGWLTSVTPAASGAQTVPVGSPLSLHAMVNPPDCDGDSSIVRWITSDPFMPGHEDTCVTVIRCREMVTPVVASLVSAQASPDGVILRWSLGDPSYLPVGVWRRTQDSGWDPLGAASGSGGAWRFEDRSVTPGARYAYRLELRRGAETEFAGETWVQVPGVGRFGIAGVTPNPATSDLEVAFSLAVAGAARLELFDVAGRSVMTHETGELPPGPHRIRLGAARQVPAGVYTVRLVQGARQASVRAAIVR